MTQQLMSDGAPASLRAAFEAKKLEAIEAMRDCVAERLPQVVKAA